MSEEWLKFWWWVEGFVRKKIEKQWMNGRRVTIKCENCKLWIHETCSSGDEVDIKHDCGDWGYSWTCNQCGHKSYWNAIAFPFPARANSEGHIIQEEENAEVP